MRANSYQVLILGVVCGLYCGALADSVGSGSFGKVLSDGLLLAGFVVLAIAYVEVAVRGVEK